MLNSVSATEIQGIAITNQRETMLIWNRITGVAIYNAIVWQDRRGAEECQKLINYQEQITQKTGLILEDYFCASKISWILDHVAGAREMAHNGSLAFGTGGFIMVNTGKTPARSQHKLLTTIAYKIDNQPVYAVEGSIFMAGAVMQWLHDNLGILNNIEDSAQIASQLVDTNGVYLVPAFTGLGAPHWLPHAKGIISGLTRDSTKNHIIRAGLESILTKSTIYSPA